MLFTDRDGVFEGDKEEHAIHITTSAMVLQLDYNELHISTQ